MRNRSKSHVLIVDDNRDIVLGAELRLRAAGYTTSSAYDANEALRSIANQRPDVILLDMVMEGINGLDLLARLRHRVSSRHIPVIILSASLRDKQAAMDAGARFFLPKPCDSDELLAALEVALQDSRSAEPSHSRRSVTLK